MRHNELVEAVVEGFNMKLPSKILNEATPEQNEWICAAFIENALLQAELSAVRGPIAAVETLADGEDTATRSLRIAFTVTSDGTYGTCINCAGGQPPGQSGAGDTSRACEVDCCKVTTKTIYIPRELLERIIRVLTEDDICLDDVASIYTRAAVALVATRSLLSDLNALEQTQSAPSTPRASQTCPRASEMSTTTFPCPRCGNPVRAGASGWWWCPHCRLGRW